MHARPERGSTSRRQSSTRSTSRRAQCRDCPAGSDIPATDPRDRKERPREVHAVDLPEPRGLPGPTGGGAHRGDERRRHARRGADRVRRTARRRGARRSVERQDRPRPRRCAGRDGRAVRRGQGAAGRLLPGRLRDARAGDRDRRALAGRPVLGGRGAAADDRRRGRRCEDSSAGVEDLLRRLAPQVLGALVRRYGQFDACEDAVQEALLAAAVQWPRAGRAGEPARLADHGRVAPADRRAAQRAGAPAPRGDGGAQCRPTSSSRRRRTSSAAGRGRHADAAVPVLPSRAVAGRRRSRSRCARSAA